MNFFGKVVEHHELALKPVSTQILTVTVGIPAGIGEVDSEGLSVTGEDRV